MIRRDQVGVAATAGCCIGVALYAFDTDLPLWRVMLGTLFAVMAVLILVQHWRP